MWAVDGGKCIKNQLSLTLFDMGGGLQESPLKVFKKLTFDVVMTPTMSCLDTFLGSFENFEKIKFFE